MVQKYYLKLLIIGLKITCSSTLMMVELVLDQEEE